MKPIHFPKPVADEIIRAILDNHKTVTRRVVKPQPPPTSHVAKIRYSWSWSWWEDSDSHEMKPPYRPGDILYVRETWRAWRARLYEADIHIEFKTGGEGSVLQFQNGHTDSTNREDYDNFFKKWGVGTRWHPSIHMPHKAARLFLRVMSVYLQQLKEVTEEDAKSEGFGSRADFVSELLKMYPDSTEESWFWVIEFEKISKEEAMKHE